MRARDFSSAESFKSGGILDVFPAFETARMEEKIRCPAADDLFRDSLRQDRAITPVRFGGSFAPKLLARKAGFNKKSTPKRAFFGAEEET